MKSWQLQEAKAYLSQVVKDATQMGPQQITVRGEATVVVVSMALYEKLIHKKPSFIDFIRQSPLMGDPIPIKRDPSMTRDIDL